MTTAQALCLIYLSRDDGKTWDLVKPADVPDWVKDPDIMANMLNGECVSIETGLVLPEGSRPWYRAERVDSAGVTVQ